MGYSILAWFLIVYFFVAALACLMIRSHNYKKQDREHEMDNRKDILTVIVLGWFLLPIYGFFYWRGDYDVAPNPYY